MAKANIPDPPFQSEFTAPMANMYAKNQLGPEHFGSGIASGLDKLSDATFQLSVAKEEMNNETAVLDAYARAAKEKGDLLYDPDKGIFARKGVDAVGAVDGFDTEAERIGRNASANLTPKAKSQFDKMWKRSNISDQEGIMKFSLGQAKDYKAETGNALIDIAANNAIQGYNDPNVIARSKTEILGATMSIAQGASPEATSELLLKGYSAMHKGIIYKMAADSPAKAEQYFQAHSGELTSADNVNLTNYLRGQTFHSSVLKDAERITNTHGPVGELYDTISTGPDRSKTGDPLLDALEQQESGGQHRVETKNYDRRGNAIPEKTAVGVTQVLISTAREISVELNDGLMEGKSTDQVKELLKDKVINRRYGTHYLGKALKNFGGDLEAALIAYNAGPGNARKWLNAGRDYEVLPDRAQTEPYVRNVMSMYKRNLNESGRFPKTANSLDTAGIQPTATDAQRTNFSTVLKTDAGKAQILPEVQDAAAQMFDDMPQIVQDGLKWASSGGDILALITPRKGDRYRKEITEDQIKQVRTEQGDAAFAKEWLMTNAPTYGLSAADEEGQVKLTAGARPQTFSAEVHSENDLGEWLDQADKIQDPTRREAVIKELTQRHDVLEKARKQDELQAKRDAWGLALEGKEIPIELKKQIDPSYLTGIERYTKLKAAGKITTDWQTFVNIRLMSTEELKGIGDVMQFREKLADKEFDQLVDMVRDAKGVGKPENKGMAGIIRTRTQIVKDTIGKTLKNKPEAEGMLNRQLDADVEAFHDTYGKPPDGKEIQSMVDRLLLRTRRSESGFFSSSSSVSVYDLKPGDVITEPMVADVKDIPAVHRDLAVANAPQLFKRPLTPDEMRFAYTAAVAWRRGAYIRTPDSIRLKLVEMGISPDNADRAFGKTSALIFGVK